MIFHPKSFIETQGSFIFPKKVDAVANSCLNSNIIKEFWHNFTFQTSMLNINESEEFIFSVGNTKKLPLDGYAYSINVDKNGVFISAASKRDLFHGLMTLLDLIKAVDIDDIAAEITCCQIKDKAKVQDRMVHFCIFPETKLWELQRFIRFSAALKYTHIILEFWGMLRYDCMRELSWKNDFTKEQVRPFIEEADSLGLEVIPMFNHWGHASAGRIMHGKHVVLDQNPRLQTYFSEDGWCWDISKPKVKKLLGQIRNELIELCGNGNYFHIGCDEAVTYDQTPENLKVVSDFINEISNEMSLKNRRVILWGDMFLCRRPDYSANKYACFAATLEAEQFMLKNVTKDVLIADWQYYATQAPVETAAVFKNAGFESLLCSADKGDAQLNAILTTVDDQKLRGFMHTTWHRLSSGMHFVMLAAVKGFDENSPMKSIQARTASAALMRKVMPIHGDYQKSGWSRFEVDCLW